MIRWVLACVVLVGCSSEDIVPGICGNGVVEDFEDCDGGERCVACSIPCDDISPCQELAGTQGFVCGPDGFCHAPSGELELTNLIARPTENFAISNIDSQGPSELLVQTKTEIAAISSVADPVLASTLALKTPIGVGSASFGDVDLDAKADVLMPTADGIVIYTSQFGVPSPFPFPSLSTAGLGNPELVRALSGGRLAIATKAGQTLKMFVVDVSGVGKTLLANEEVCVGSEVGTQVDRFDMVEVEPNRFVAALKLVGNAQSLCIVNIDLGVASATIQTAKLAVANLTSRPVLADLRGQACPSLVIRKMSTLVEYIPVSSQPPCAYTSPIDLGEPGDVGLVDPIGAVRLDPAIAGKRSSALVLESGIYSVSTTDTLEEMYRSDRALETVTSADIDGDGDLDAIATGKDADAIDLLDRRDDPSGFLRFRFATEGRVDAVLAGDYDGDERVDLAYVESGIPAVDGVTLEEGGEFVDRLAIAFGTADQLLPGTVMGTFGTIEHLIPAQLQDSTDVLDVIDDLAIVFSSGQMPGPPTVSLLHGSPQRAMLAFFEPREPVGPDSRFRDVLAGNFQTADPSVLAIELDDSDVHVYVEQATGDPLGSAAPRSVANFIECAANEAFEAFCVDEARYLAFPSGDRDIMLGIDHQLSVAALDPNSIAPAAELWANPFPEVADGSFGLFRLNAFKKVLAPDGAPRLLVGLRGRLKDTDGELFLCTFDLLAGPSCVDVSAAVTAHFVALDDPGAAILPTEVVCIDAAVGHVAPTRRFVPADTDDAELVVLCRIVRTADGQPFLEGEAVFRVSFDLSKIARLEIAGADGVSSDQIQIGDVSGDGIDDLVLLERPLLKTPVYRVIHQCNSRETSCQQRSDDPAMGMGGR